MVRILTRYFLLVLFLASAARVTAFSPLGPNNEAYQVPIIGYFGFGGPKNLGEEYRLNRPVLYYAVNGNFLDYFGSNGLAAVEGAFTLLNGLTNVSSYDTNLADVPLQTMRENFRAQALGLLDMKTEVLTFALKQMGLAESEDYVWTLHNRYNDGSASCPGGMVYDVIKRNFDYLSSSPDQLQPSSYVNGTLYSYLILERCTGANPLADAVEFAVDPTAETFTSVASEFVSFGQFYTGLTRDDVAGLRYLLRANNYNIESAGSDTITFVTNNAIQLLYTSNLTVLAQASLTNDAVALAGLFPGLQIASTISYFTNVVSTNTFFYFTNYPWAPAAAASVVSGTVAVTNVVTHYKHEFANVITNRLYTSGVITVTTSNFTSSACSPFTPAGLICLSVTQNSQPIAGVFGDYILLPTNACGISLIATQLVQTVANDSVTVVATNTPGANTGTQFFSQTTSSVYTQYVFQARSVVCPTDSVGLRQGIERVQFVRRDFDSLLGRFFLPVTNSYNIVTLTNNTLITNRVQRVITTPDFLIDAQDLAPGPSQNSAVPTVARSIVFDQSNVNPGLAGPGTIEPGSTLTFNKVGPIYQNLALNFLDEAGQTLWFIWGSFDGTTNAPVIFPNGTDILNLENQLIIQISPAGPALVNGRLGINYSTAFSGFTVIGGTAPYHWSLSPGSAGLPPGISLNTTTGQLVGLPTTQGTYDFSIRVMDATSRYVDRNYSITITP